MIEKIRAGIRRLDTSVSRVESVILVTVLLFVLAASLSLMLKRNLLISPALLARACEGSIIAALILAFLRRSHRRDWFCISSFLLALRLCMEIESGLDPLMRLSVLWIGFIGASLAFRSRDHVLIDLPMPPRWRRIRNAVVPLVGIAVLALLQPASWTYFLDSFADPAYVVLLPVDLQVSAAFARSILPLGMALLLWRQFVSLVTQDPRDTKTQVQS